MLNAVDFNVKRNSMCVKNVSRWKGLLLCLMAENMLWNSCSSFVQLVHVLRLHQNGVTRFPETVLGKDGLEIALIIELGLQGM